MSFREEDRQKNCPSRGLGIAAAAMGVGVGAALYCFFSKGQENPHNEGSTSGNWSCDRSQAFCSSHHNEDSDCYSTISEHSTTDTSMNDTSLNESTEYTTDTTSQSDSSTESVVTISDNEYTSNESSLHDYVDNDSFETGYLTLPTINNSIVDSDSNMMGWDVTNSSLDVPRMEPRSPRSPLLEFFDNLGALLSPTLTPLSRPERTERRREVTTEEQQMNTLREQAFRERSWSLEECSICFEVMLGDQELMTLQCTHNFHAECIMPWLQERQTCPNCRKAAE